jgi:hypothetical protein
MNDDWVSDILASAVAAVDRANVPTDLRAAAFTAALRLLADEEPAAAGRDVPALRRPTNQPPPGGAPTTSSSSLLETVAAGLELDPSKIGKLFAEKDGEPELILKTRELPTAKSEAAQELSLVVMAARQLGGVEEYTEAEVLRSVCRRYGKFDSANFATHMKKLDNLIITKGRGVNVQRKLTQPGVEEASRLATKYLGKE